MDILCVAFFFFFFFLATVSVEGLIDVCQPSSELLPEANFQSKLGHIPLGSLWQLHRGTPKVWFPPKQSLLPFQNMNRLSRFPLNSDHKLFLWETFSESGPRSPLWAGIPLPSEKEWGSQLLTRTPGWPAAFMPVELAEQHGDYWSVLPTTECMSVCTEIKGNWA